MVWVELKLYFNCIFSVVVVASYTVLGKIRGNIGSKADAVRMLMTDRQ